MLSKEKLPFIQDTILLTGETGSGKSSMAKWIHHSSNRASRKFIQLNINSISEQLFESELFGHKKGSFTGATHDKIGFCETVGKGTLFLDEIGDLNLELQKKLLTLMDEKIFYPVGSIKPMRFEGELIVATHRNLLHMVQQKKFRQDLYYRLCGFQYDLKPLRDRVDKRKLIEFQIQSERVRVKSSAVMTEHVRSFLYSYEYPGNFRELKQLIKYLFFVSSTKIELVNLPDWVSARDRDVVNSDNYYDALRQFEKSFIVEKLKKYKGKINHTAQSIHISKVTLISKIKKYDISIPQLKMEVFNGI